MGANIFPCAKVLAFAKDFEGAKVLDAPISNGNDIETKRNEAKRYFDNRGIFSIEAKRTDLFQNFERSKQSEHIYVYSLQDRSVQNFPGSNKNELG